MSSPVAKTVKRLSSRSSSRTGGKSSAGRKAVSKSTRLKPATKRSPAGKARAQKAAKSSSSKKPVAKRAGSKTVATKSRAKASTKRPTRPVKAVAPRRAPMKTIVKPVKKPYVPPTPTFDEAAALSAFEAAHREFTRGRFAEARNQFRALVDKYPSVSEVAARSRTYLAIAESRLRTDLAAPRDADSLYDRGVIELNRGEYVAAQELFERALKREPEAAHIHYGLAASRARLGAVDTALKSLRRALDLQPSLRIRAQRDSDLNSLRSDTEFEQLIFAIREQ